MSAKAPGALADIRQRIDTIDAEIHRLLIERSAVIDQLIHLKGISAPAAAFRPDREALMMRGLVMRHEGILPLATVEHIWREVISTFTAMQAPFHIMIAEAPDRAAFQDLVRFQFGFSVPAEEAGSDAAAVEKLRADEGFIAIFSPYSTGGWWRMLGPDENIQIFARLPFIITPDHPVQAEAYVAGPRLAASNEADTRLVRMTATGPFAGTLAAFNGRVIATAEADDGEEILAEMPCALKHAELVAEGEKRGARFSEPVVLGSFAAPIRFVATDAEESEEETL